MAHKHNRRRARPRSRQNKNRKDNCGYNGYDHVLSYESLSYSPPIFVTPPEHTYASASAYPFPLIHTMDSSRYHDPIQHIQELSHIAPKDAINVESQRLRMFGGDPGDDIDLCYKMMEVFEGMEWVKP